jgi:hypothetical protein
MNEIETLTQLREELAVAREGIRQKNIAPFFFLLGYHFKDSYGKIFRIQEIIDAQEIESELPEGDYGIECKALSVLYDDQGATVSDGSYFHVIRSEIESQRITKEEFDSTFSEAIDFLREYV